MGKKGYPRAGGSSDIVLGKKGCVNGSEEKGWPGERRSKQKILSDFGADVNNSNGGVLDHIVKDEGGGKKKSPYIKENEVNRREKIQRGTGKTLGHLCQRCGHSRAGNAERREKKRGKMVLFAEREDRWTERTC